MDLISIVIPVYNVVPYLRECMDSVLNQTYSNWELIIIDDGSTDGSGTICDEYAAQDSRIQVIHKENEGQGVARNIGMERAQGKYLIFLDSDDYWALNTLEILYAEAEKNDVEILSFSNHSFSDGVKLPQNVREYLVFKAQDRQVQCGSVSWKCMEDNDEFSMSVCRRFYRLDFLRKTGIQFPANCIHEDESFSFLTYIAAKRVEQISDVLYHRRWHPGSTMTHEIKKYAKSARGYSVAMREVLAAYQQKKAGLTDLEQSLYIKRVEMYYYATCTLHAKTLWESQTEARKLQQEVQPFLRKAIAELSKPTKYELLCSYSLWLSNWLLTVKSKIFPHKGQEV